MIREDISRGDKKSNPSVGRSLWKLPFKASVDFRLPSSITEKQGQKEGAQSILFTELLKETKYLPIYHFEGRIKYSNISTVVTIGRIRNESVKAANEEFSF